MLLGRVEELRGKGYDEARVKKLEELFQGWIKDEEVDDKHIFLEAQHSESGGTHLLRFTNSVLPCEGVWVKQETLEPEKKRLFV